MSHSIFVTYKILNLWFQNLKKLQLIQLETAEMLAAPELQLL